MALRFGHRELVRATQATFAKKKCPIHLLLNNSRYNHRRVGVRVNLKNLDGANRSNLEGARCRVSVTFNNVEERSVKLDSSESFAPSSRVSPSGGALEFAVADAAAFSSPSFGASSRASRPRAA